MYKWIEEMEALYNIAWSEYCVMSPTTDAGYKYAIEWNG